jgi:hypothetical protein
VLATDSRQSSAKSITNNFDNHHHHQQKNQSKQISSSQHDLRQSLDNHNQVKQQTNDYKQIKTKTPDTTSYQKQQTSIKNPDNPLKQSSIKDTATDLRPLSSKSKPQSDSSKQQIVNIQRSSNHQISNKNTKLLNLITDSNDEVPIFDPEPVYEIEALPLNKTMVMKF